MTYQNNIKPLESKLLNIISEIESIIIMKENGTVNEISINITEAGDKIQTLKTDLTNAYKAYEKELKKLV